MTGDGLRTTGDGLRTIVQVSTTPVIDNPGNVKTTAEKEASNDIDVLLTKMMASHLADEEVVDRCPIDQQLLLVREVNGGQLVGWAT
ncbi:hypothetical protein LWI29_003839 [Acer saccharum]|uniref:Uncharacterized protein n=1 Tax=Acer saccharum TaxID=4024 RepID=A0AA39RH07_ACESA|nr:hypothetical protein LWI29_003839 [Acer saccharum]